MLICSTSQVVDSCFAECTANVSGNSWYNLKNRKKYFTVAPECIHLSLKFPISVMLCL
jgi:hypothetical protein